MSNNNYYWFILLVSLLNIEGCINKSKEQHALDILFDTTTRTKGYYEDQGFKMMEFKGNHVSHSYGKLYGDTSVFITFSGGRVASMLVQVNKENKKELVNRLANLYKVEIENCEMIKGRVIQPIKGKVCFCIHETYKRYQLFRKDSLGNI